MNLIVEGSRRILFLACASNVMDRVDWFPAMGHKKELAAPIRDKFFAWDLKADTVTELTMDGPEEFVSHGIDVVVTGSGKVAIYAVNHRYSGSTIEKYTHTLGSKSLEHIKTFEDQDLVYTPNDVYVADERDDLFFVTNDHMFRVGLPRRLETMLQLPTTHVAVHGNSLGGFKLAKNFLDNVNGLAGDRKGTLFLNHVNAKVSVLKYKPDGNLTLSQTIYVKHAIDNPTYSSETNELIVSGFPTALELEEFTKHPHEVASASAASRINLDEIGSKFFGGEGQASNIAQPAVTEFFLDPGTGVMNMSTSVVVDKVGDAWYMTSVFGFAVVKCTGYAKTYQTVTRT